MDMTVFIIGKRVWKPNPNACRWGQGEGIYVVTFLNLFWELEEIGGIVLVGSGCASKCFHEFWSALTWLPAHFPAVMCLMHWAHVLLLWGLLQGNIKECDCSYVWQSSTWLTVENPSHMDVLWTSIHMKRIYSLFCIYILLDLFLPWFSKLSCDLM